MTDFLPNPPDEYRERVERMLEDMKERNQKVGLYLEAALVNAAPGFDDEEGQPPERLMVAATFSIGERAFRTQIQDPEQHQFDEQFREIKVDMEADEVEQAKEDLRRMLRENEDE